MRQSLECVFQSRKTFRSARRLVDRAQELHAGRIANQLEILVHVGKPLTGALLFRRRKQYLHPRIPLKPSPVL